MKKTFLLLIILFLLSGNTKAQNNDIFNCNRYLKAIDSVAQKHDTEKAKLYMQHFILCKEEELGSNDKVITNIKKIDYIRSYFDHIIIAKVGRETQILNKQFEKVKSYGFVGPDFSFRGDLAIVTSNNKKGCINRVGQEVIPIIYDDIERPYKHFLLIATKDKKKGVLNRIGEEVIPVRYDHIVRKDSLFLARKKGEKDVLINKYGKIVKIIEDKENNFINGLALVSYKYGKWHFINKKGERVGKKIKFNDIAYIDDSLALVGNSYKDKWFFIDKTGERIGEKFNADIRYYENDCVEKAGSGIFKIKIGGGYHYKYIFVDTTGKIITREYNFADIFHEGLAHVVYKGNHGYINMQGKEVISLKYDYSYDFNEGLARVCHKDKYGFINRQGEEVIPTKYDGAADFSEGLARVYIGEILGSTAKYGFIDKVGKEVIPLKYDDADNFIGNLTWVKKGKKYGLINKEGEEISSFIYNRHTSYKYFFKNNLARLEKNGKWAFVDSCGVPKTDFIYDQLQSFNEGISRVYRNGRYGYVNLEGEEIIPVRYDFLVDYCVNGMIKVWDRASRKWGMINKLGETVMPLEYSYIGYMTTDGLAWVYSSGKYGFVNTKGNLVIPMEYDLARNFLQGYAHVKKDGYWFYINTKNKCVKFCP